MTCALVVLSRDAGISGRDEGAALGDGGGGFGPLQRKDLQR